MVEAVGDAGTTRKRRTMAREQRPEGLVEDGSVS